MKVIQEPMFNMWVYRFRCDGCGALIEAGLGEIRRPYDLPKDQGLINCPLCFATNNICLKFNF